MAHTATPPSDAATAAQSVASKQTAPALPAQPETKADDRLARIEQAVASLTARVAMLVPEPRSSSEKVEISKRDTATLLQHSARLLDRVLQGEAPLAEALRLAGRRPHSENLQQHHDAVAAGDPEAVAVQRALMSACIHVHRDGETPPTDRKQTKAIKKAQDVYDRSPEVLDRVCRVIAAAWPDYTGTIWGTTFTSLEGVLVGHSNIFDNDENFAELIRVLALYTPETLRAKVRSYPSKEVTRHAIALIWRFWNHCVSCGAAVDALDVQDVQDVPDDSPERRC